MNSATKCLYTNLFIKVVQPRGEAHFLFGVGEFFGSPVFKELSHFVVALIFLWYSLSWYRYGVVIFFFIGYFIHTMP